MFEAKRSPGPHEKVVISKNIIKESRTLLMGGKVDYDKNTILIIHMEDNQLCLKVARIKYEISLFIRNLSSVVRCPPHLSSL